MAAERHIVAFLLFVIAGAALPCASQAKSDQAGEIRALLPVGYIVRGGAPAITVQRGDPIYWQDTVHTERGGRVRIGLLDGGIVNVGSDSSLVVIKHDRATQQTQLELTYGRMRAKAVRIVQPHGSFEVRTPVAVTGVAGTGFYITTTDDLTFVLCTENAVRVRNIDDRIVGEVTLHAGEFTLVRRGMPPTAPASASAEQLRESDEATSMPAAPLDWSRVEVSWPPPNCGQEFTLLVRAWSRQVQDGKPVETPVDPELIAGKLLLGNATLAVDGGQADLASAPSSLPEGTFVPAGKQTPVPAKIWPPRKIAEGQGWRTSRAVFVGSAFYVLGPVGIARQLAFTFADQSATLLWVGPCGAGFLAPTIPGGAYPVTLSVGGQPLARGQMNLVQVSYDVPRPPALVRGQTTQFGIELRGLAGLDKFVQGRPIDVTIVTNRSPAILGDLRSQTPGSSVNGETITYRLDVHNVDASGNARLDASGRGLQRGEFDLGVESKLDEALELPGTPLTLARSGP